MTTRLPSVEFLVDLSRAESGRQYLHFDALDTKAGVVLGFAAVLVALSPDIEGWWRTLGVVAAFFCGISALLAFWPRSSPVLRIQPLRTYGNSELDFTRLTVLDTLAHMQEEMSTTLERKARWVKWALGFLAAAATSFGGGVIVS